MPNIDDREAYPALAVILAGAVPGIGTGNKTGVYLIADLLRAALAPKGIAQIAPNTQTLDADLVSVAVTANTADTTIQTFNNGQQGQMLTLIAGDVYSSINTTGNITTLTGGRIDLVQGRTYSFVRRAAKWVQLKDSVEGMSVDNGDNGAALYAGRSEHTQIWQSPLSVSRTATLGAPGYNGAEFLIVRAATATGAQPLLVKEGVVTLATLAAGQSARFKYTGSAWMLVERSTLS